MNVYTCIIHTYVQYRTSSELNQLFTSQLYLQYLLCSPFISVKIRYVFAVPNRQEKGCWGVGGGRGRVGTLSLSADSPDNTGPCRPIHPSVTMLICVCVVTLLFPSGDWRKSPCRLILRITKQRQPSSTFRTFILHLSMHTYICTSFRNRWSFEWLCR